MEHGIYPRISNVTMQDRRVIFYFLLTLLVVMHSPVYGLLTEETGHLLNRIAYGPCPNDIDQINQTSLQAYIEQQLNPAGIDETSNVALIDREDALFTELIPVKETSLVFAGEFWDYFKGTEEPDPSWNQPGYDSTSWERGSTGIGYGDGDDETILTDMRRIDDDLNTPEDESQPGYLSVYLRLKFSLSAEELTEIDELILRIDYDDSFKAYLNGTEVEQSNLPAGMVAHNQQATGSHEAGTPEDLDISDFKGTLVVGDNVLAIQVHNRSYTSSDLSIMPQLLNRKVLPDPPRRVIRGIDELQQLLHVRGIYSRRQLQAVLAEFWENHFTTDYDKLVDYFDDLQNSNAADAMSLDQARAEAAQVEYLEYEFFYQNALGNFGDLLLYSATSPSMLVYLDNVLNIKGAANENYAREILELSAFGVDNGYLQVDIEELAKCFTGWSTCKVEPGQSQSFPDSAQNPPTECGVLFDDEVVLDLGPGWKYFKGTNEPSPGSEGEPTTEWTVTDFNDIAWIDGSTGIGYGDDDDATILEDMRGNYTSVYLRRSFDVNDLQQFENLILEVNYDDGFVAYLNGVHIGRSATMEDHDTIVAHNLEAGDNHEVSEGPDMIGLTRFRGILRPGTNVLAIQVHNTSIDSSDLSILPRLLDRHILPGSIENGDRNGIWTFMFRPDQHDTSQKVIFQGTPYETIIPAGRTGLAGLQDALEPIETMVAHPSTAEFICIKLIQKFVSDDISLITYKNGTAPAELIALTTEAINAWQSTTPPGHIETILRTLLDPQDRDNFFWSSDSMHCKVKSPVEYINSSLRAIQADASGKELPQLNESMGMHLFTRDAPDGFSELGSDWIDTASLQARIDFVRNLAFNLQTEYSWDPFEFLADIDIRSAEEIVDFFNELLFQGTLPPANRDLLIEYLNTDLNGTYNSLQDADTEELQQRIQQFTALVLSLPNWNYQ